MTKTVGLAKQTIDELLEEATIGQLKPLASHPRSHYVGNVMSSDENGPRVVCDDDPMPLNTQKANVKSFTRRQVPLLRSTGSKSVSAKAAKVLKRRRNVHK